MKDESDYASMRLIHPSAFILHPFPSIPSFVHLQAVRKAVLGSAGANIRRGPVSGYETKSDTAKPCPNDDDLLSKSELPDNRQIAGSILMREVLQQTIPLADHLQKPAAGRMVLLVRP